MVEILDHPTMYECPQCGCDPEMMTTFQDTKTKVRVGYQCSCGAVVINGLLVEHNITDMRTVRKEA